MFGLYFANKWKSQRYGKIINRMSGILNDQSLSTVLVTHKVGYSNYKSWELKNNSRIWSSKR